MATKTYNAQTLLVAAKPRNKRLREIGYQGGSSAVVDVDLTPYLLKAIFDDMFEKVNIGSEEEPKWSIKAKYGLWTEQFLSAKGVDPNGTATSAGGGLDYEALEEWINENMPLILADYAKRTDIPSLDGYLQAGDIDGLVDADELTTAITQAKQWVTNNYLSKEEFQRLFRYHDGTEDGIPESIEAMLGLWTEQFLSAKGVGSGTSTGGGGGGGIDYEALEEYLNDKLEIYLSQYAKTEDLKQLFLSKLSDDVAQGRITFQQGLDSLGLSVFADGATFGDFISGFVGGRGAAIDALGNAEVESLKVRSSLEVIELLINRLAAIEGDQLLTEADTIESVTDLGSNCYRLQLKSKWDGYFTAITAGSVLKGIYNTLALSQTPGSDTPAAYFTSWMRVNSVNQAANSIEVSLYPDNQVPSGTNHIPVELMNIARWGHQTDATRQSCLYLSSTEGKIVKLKGVTAPIISESNIALSLGTIPSFVYSYLFGQGKPVSADEDLLYADSIAVRNLYYYPKGDGTCEVEYVDRGRWQPGGNYYYRAPGTLANGKWEVSDVWHYGCKWRCMANLTADEPKWSSTAWAMIEGNPNFTVEIDVPEGFYDPDDFHAEFNASARLYNRDISLDCLPGTSTPAVTWEWRRRSYDSAGNERVASDAAWASQFAQSARGGKPHIEIDDADLSIDSLTGRPKKIVFIAIATLPDGSVQTQEIEIA